MSKGLSTQWTAHLKTPKERDDFADLVRNTTQVLTRLQTMIRQGGQTEQREALKPEAFENPAWAYKQAFLLGKQARDAQLLQLLSFLDH